MNTNIFDFRCFSVSPSSSYSPNIAIATARAGGVGVLDLEFCDLSDAQVLRNVTQLVQSTTDQENIGLRLPCNRLPLSPEIVDSLAERHHWLIISQWTGSAFATLAPQLPNSSQQKILLEVTTVEQLDDLIQFTHSDAVSAENNDGSQAALLAKADIVVKGSECGGWVGEDTAFILLQKVICAKVRAPQAIYVQGGIGIATAASCRALGVAGVGLDDQLLLMPESSFPESWKQHIYTLSGQEAVLLGELLGAPLRILMTPRLPKARDCQTLAEQCEINSATRQAWQAQVAPLVGWGEPKHQAWPIGQAIGMAQSLAAQYRTTGRLIQAIQQQSQIQVELAQHLQPFAAHAPLAQSHGTTYPIVQGPMTRVSDVPEFAHAVAQAGALPMLALALLKGPQIEILLRQTQHLLGDRPWGIGILGFVPAALREEQLAIVRAFKPPFALIAGGRPDQATQLEAEGIATYLHVPTVKLLQFFLSQGCRRFVFEGRECGGHVGPLSSFVLWEGAVRILLQELPAHACSEIHVLFAGGIHDECSAAMVSAMAAPLVDRGMKVGVWMGSAYLFTQEAVDCGAIVSGFQEQVLQCKNTVNLQTSPGHASRCATTPFTQEFHETRRRLLQKQCDAEMIKNNLEDLTLGRLRVAAKGLVRTVTGLQSVTEQEQLQKGMYMVGQVATLRDRRCTLQELHASVSQGSVERLSQLPQFADVTSRQSGTVSESPASSVTTSGQSPNVSDVAIIGIATLLPKAHEPDEFWENILNGVNAITEIPPNRWDWRLYYDAERHTPDKVYSRWGGFLDELPFDPVRFGIPPKSLKQIEPMQLLTLEAVRRALADAGYEDGNFDRQETSVILGMSGGLSDLGQQYATRAELPQRTQQFDPDTWARLPEWTEESFPGLLFNVTAGRVANRFDCGGSNFTVDAACASSLAAIDLAVAELQSGRCNMAISGGVDTLQSPFAYLCFSKTQALSPQGVARTFDQNADGIVISEGVAVLILKRLTDAERDGDKIYAVIKAVASSSDGKGLSMTAPASNGQRLAFLRAYQKAGRSPQQLGLYEAHGTGTAVGDRTELETITTILKEQGALPQSCVIGSVKTQIGHTKSAAGATALAKAALALHHKVLPTHSNVETPLALLQEETIPVYLLQAPQPWLRRSSNRRLAGVSAFGFGGTNFHAVLEEYDRGYQAQPRGANNWPCELFVWQVAEDAELLVVLQQLSDQLAIGITPQLRDLAYTLVLQVEAGAIVGGTRLSIVASTHAELANAITLVIQHLQTPSTADLPIEIQLHRVADSPETAPKIAFLFPGQGSQYPGMAREVALYCAPMADALEVADAQLAAVYPKYLSQYIYPVSAYSVTAEQQAETDLKKTNIAQPAIGAVETGYLDLLTSLGVQADMVAGHSYGEYTALHAAGVLSRADFLALSKLRGQVMADACGEAQGTMAAIKASQAEVIQALTHHQDVSLANYNAPLQIVVSGPTVAVQALVAMFQSQDIFAKLLPVAGAFHSPLVATAQTPLAQAIATTPMQSPTIPVYSNITAAPYEPAVPVIRQQLSQHLTSQVKFLDQIQAMYEAGARIFVEVGPNSILTRLVQQILVDQSDYTAISLDSKGQGLKALLTAFGHLFVQGSAMRLSQLYAERPCQTVNWNRLKQTAESALTATTCFVSGAGIRLQGDAVVCTGKLPPISRDTLTDAAIYSVPVAASSPPSPPISQALNMFKNNSNPLPQNSEFQPLSTQPTHPGRHSLPAADGLAAYHAYQQTMLEFLRVQERVMQSFLDSSGSSASALNGHPLSSGYADQDNNAHRLLHNYEPARALEPLSQPSNGSIITSPVSQPLPTAAPVTAERVVPTLEHAGLVQLILGVVSELTGYPPEMLGMDEDIEADLGIDSIKRVEIFSALLDALPKDWAEAVKPEMEQLVQMKTFNKLTQSVMNIAAASAARQESKSSAKKS